MKQVPPSRLIPLWGGISAHGFATILFHPERKTNSEDWSDMVKKGKLVQALKSINPKHTRGSWKILCDGESFLHCDDSRAAHKDACVRLIQIPAKSPDLNPVERFWSWLRRALRALDLEDLANKRPVPGKLAYKQRIINVLRSEKAQQVARNIFKGHRAVCKKIVKNKGAAVTGA